MLFCKKKYDDKRKELFEKLCLQISLSDLEQSSELSFKIFSMFLNPEPKTHVPLVNDFIRLHT